MTALKSALVAAALALVLPPLAARAAEAGDAVFAERGPWALEGHDLVWHLTVEGPDAPGFLAIKDGAVRLSQATDPSDGQPVLQLTLNTDARTRKIGPFPISGGDPAVTFFLEQTTRDMARLTGGSPFYIRNRIKDALFRGGSLTREGERLTAIFRPFQDDRNAARMQGFETLELRFVIADPKAPIREMTAATTPTEGAAYRNRMVLE